MAIRRAFAGTVVLAVAAGAMVAGSAPAAGAVPDRVPTTTSHTAVEPSTSEVGGGRHFTALAPQRILDTRIGLGAAKGPVGPGRSIDVTVTGVAGIPATGVAAVVFNLTAAASTAGGYLTVYPTGRTRPTASNLNLTRGQIVANEVIATVGTSGKVTIFNAMGDTHVLADVSGWFSTGSYYTGLSPARVLDTRTGLGAPAAPVGPGRQIDVQLAGRGGVPATGATAVAVNLTGTRPTAETYVTAYPTGQARPTTSNLNLARNQTAAVLVIAELGTGGKITLYNNSGTTHLIVDVVGWFTATDEFTPTAPTRIFDSRHRASGALAPGGNRAISIPTFVPNFAEAVVLSVTAVTPTGAGYLSVLPNLDPPKTSVLNFTAGHTVPNLVITAVTASMFVNVTNQSSGTTDLVVDLLGYLVARPRITSPPIATDATVSVPYTATITVAGGFSPYLCLIKSGVLPPGLSVTQIDPETFTIAGTPTTAGTYSATLRISDDRNTPIELDVGITVSPAGP